ncbi:hypothetical protein E6P06_03440 (plasmid) [Citrobacter sp. CF971]|nr:hypothetical protein E6P06_03440 [Citrobacter sp. CF971]
MGSCAAPSAKGDDKFITTDYLQQCPSTSVDLRCGIRAEPLNEHDHVRICHRCMRRSYIFTRLKSMREAYILAVWSLRSPSTI